MSDPGRVDGGGRRIETPDRFAGDDGRADPRWVQAYADPGQVESLLRAGVRLLVPIVSVLDEVDAESGADKSSHMASVSLVQADGRRGLLAFTGVETMSLWDPAAQPVPVTTYLSKNSPLAYFESSKPSNDCFFSVASRLLARMQW